MSKAQVDRARSMAKMIGASLSTRKGTYRLSDDDDWTSLELAEDKLFQALEAQGEIPRWLASHYRTWRQAKSGYDLARAATARLVPGYLEDPKLAGRDGYYRDIIRLAARRRAWAESL
jgi:hypothetical protein